MEFITTKYEDIKYIFKDNEIVNLFTDYENTEKIILTMPHRKNCIQVNDVELFSVHTISIQKSANSDYIILYFYNKCDDIISTYYMFKEDFKNFEHKHGLQFDKITYITE